MNSLFSRQKLFIEIGIFETKLITSFSKQRIKIAATEAEFGEIYPLSCENVISSYDKLQKFLHKLLSMVEGKALLSTFIGFEVYLWLGVHSQVELLSVRDILQNNNVSKVIFLKKNIWLFDGELEKNIHIDLDKFYITDAPSEGKNQLIAGNNMINLAKLAKSIIKNVEFKYGKTLSEEESYLTVQKIYLNREVQIVTSDERNLIDRVLIKEISRIITESKAKGSSVVLSGCLVHDTKILKGVIKILAGNDTKINKSNFKFLERIRKDLDRIIVHKEYYDKYSQLIL